MGLEFLVGGEDTHHLEELHLGDLLGAARLVEPREVHDGRHDEASSCRENGATPRAR